MRTLTIAVSAAAWLAACSPPGQEPPAPVAETATPAADEAPPAPPPPQGVEFRAVGQEPGWMLDITSVALDLTLDYGDTRLTLPPRPPSYPEEGVTRYETRNNEHTLTVTITRTPCADSMSGAQYPARAEIVIDGRRLEGCGRS
ncbi:MAG: COG3650 family protein [Hyphomonadaceae bacterium]